tara:strand:- start:314 stop:619 length:306 start_codon:yes stop_codon:yes gene_type:complete
MLKVFYFILLAIFVFISLIFRDLNQQEVLINYFFSEVLVETAWLVIASFLSGIVFCSIFIGIEILKIKRKLKLQIRTEKKLSREFQDFKRDRDADKYTGRL